MYEYKKHGSSKSGNSLFFNQTWRSLNHDGIKQNKKRKEIKRKEKKRKLFIGKRKVKPGFEIFHPKVNLQNQHMTTRPS